MIAKVAAALSVVFARPRARNQKCRRSLPSSRARMSSSCSTVARSVPTKDGIRRRARRGRPGPAQTVHREVLHVDRLVVMGWR
ncbi:MAG: hypothetical protein JWL97_3845 [Gemmatimonadales bacterium]|jgi:hypothetical protein|nr:hypothetical protein [Gemmatimonadales bacterium]